MSPAATAETPNARFQDLGRTVEPRAKGLRPACLLSESELDRLARVDAGFGEEQRG